MTNDFSPQRLAQVGLGLEVFGAVSSAFGAYYAARSQKSSLRFQAEMARINAGLAEQGAQSELQRGQQQVGALTLKAGQIKSAQRARLAANGVDVGEGSAAEIQASTQVMSEIDRATLEANAVRSAWGYRTQAVSLQNEARMREASASAISPAGAMVTSLLTSAQPLAQSWYRADRIGKPPTLQKNPQDDPIKAMGLLKGWF